MPCNSLHHKRHNRSQQRRTQGHPRNRQSKPFSSLHLWSRSYLWLCHSFGHVKRAQNHCCNKKMSCTVSKFCHISTEYVMLLWKRDQRDDWKGLNWFGILSCSMTQSRVEFIYIELVRGIRYMLKKAICVKLVSGTLNH